LDKYLIKIWTKTVFKTPDKVVSYVAKLGVVGTLIMMTLSYCPLIRASCPTKFGQKMNLFDPSNIVTTGKPTSNQPLTRTTPTSKWVRGGKMEHRDRIWHVLTLAV
jgi:hypothetical protein